MKFLVYDGEHALPILEVETPTREEDPTKYRIVKGRVLRRVDKLIMLGSTAIVKVVV